MAASVEFREEAVSYGEIEEKDKGDDLLVFVDFNESGLDLNLLQKSDQFREMLESEPENPLMPKIISTMYGQYPGAEDLLDSENNTTDYDWLLSPPRNPVPSLELEEQGTFISQNMISSGQLTPTEYTLENKPTESTSTTNVAPRCLLSVNGAKSSNGAIRRPSPSRKVTSTGSRQATPTIKPLRSSTPTSRATVAAMKPVAPPKRSTTPTTSFVRSSTPTPRLSAASKSTSRASTSTPRPSVLAASNSTSRSSTPAQRPSNTSVSGGRSSSASKSRAPSLKTPASSRGNIPSVKSRPSKNPLEMPGSSTETPSNSKKSLPERPTSTSRGRLPSTETNPKTIPKKSSCSPSRGQFTNGNANNSLKSGATRSWGISNGDDDVNPVLMGTKMVERVVNMRKLAPPRQDHLSNPNNTSGKSSFSQDNPGFGRTLSKKSFDMALRHLDIRRSMPGNMRAMITKVPASSVYSVRLESTKTRTNTASGAEHSANQ